MMTLGDRRRDVSAIRRLLSAMSLEGGNMSGTGGRFDVAFSVLVQPDGTLETIAYGLIGGQLAIGPRETFSGWAALLKAAPDPLLEIPWSVCATGHRMFWVRGGRVCGPTVKGGAQ